jgi:hypothetical protein
MLSHLPLKDKLTLVFCLLDDSLALLPKPHSALPPGQHPAGCHPDLIPSEVLTQFLVAYPPRQFAFSAAAGAKAGFPDRQVICY